MTAQISVVGIGYIVQVLRGSIDQPVPQSDVDHGPLAPRSAAAVGGETFTVPLSVRPAQARINVTWRGRTLALIRACPVPTGHVDSFRVALRHTVVRQALGSTAPQGSQDRDRGPVPGRW